MAYAAVIAAALVVAALTLFSGFGLGSLLMPVFALFFPLETAVAATAVVHLLNNLFKVILLGRHADLGVVCRFALPAALAAAAGAYVLHRIAGLEALWRYTVGGREFVVSPVNLAIAVLIAGFTLLELRGASGGGAGAVPRSRALVPLGGLLSGFFGGLSGHQGALRTAFLLRLGLTKEALLGTMIVSAVVVDLSRLLVYGFLFLGRSFAVVTAEGGRGLVVAATLAAFAGSFIGRRLVEKVTLETLHRFVGILLLLLAVALGAGIV